MPSSDPSLVAALPCSTSLVPILRHVQPNRNCAMSLGQPHPIRSDAGTLTLHVQPITLAQPQTIRPNLGTLPGPTTVSPPEESWPFSGSTMNGESDSSARLVLLAIRVNAESEGGGKGYRRCGGTHAAGALFVPDDDSAATGCVSAVGSLGMKTGAKEFHSPCDVRGYGVGGDRRSKPVSTIDRVVWK